MTTSLATLSTADNWLDTWQPAVLWLAGANALTTRRAYAYPVRCLMLHSGVPLAELREIHCLAYKANLVNRRLANRTVRHHIIVLCAFFRWAIEAGHYQGPNPAASIPLPRVSGGLAGVALDNDQVESLIAEGRNYRDRAILAVMCAAGLRVAEACALQQRDVHFQKQDILLSVRNGKGGKAREIRLQGEAHAPLLAYMAIRAYAGPTTYLFQALNSRAARGRPLSQAMIYRIVTAAATRASLGHVSPHDLRRTYATIALDNGWTLPAVQRQMGHKLMEQTAAYYRGGNK